MHEIQYEMNEIRAELLYYNILTGSVAGGFFPMFLLFFLRLCFTDLSACSKTLSCAMFSPLLRSMFLFFLSVRGCCDTAFSLIAYAIP